MGGLTQLLQESQDLPCQAGEIRLLHDLALLVEELRGVEHACGKRLAVGAEQILVVVLERAAAGRAGVHDHVAVLVDGDPAGDRYVTDLLSCDPPPCCVIQWPTGWAVEDIIRWVLDAEATTLLNEINNRLERQFLSLDELVEALKNNDGRTGGLKTHYMAHEDIAGAMRMSQACVRRAEELLESVTRAVLNRCDGLEHLVVDETRSRGSVYVYRFLA